MLILRQEKDAMFHRPEIEDELEVQYLTKKLPEREARRVSQCYSPRFEKRRTPVRANHGIQRRGKRSQFCIV